MRRLCSSIEWNKQELARGIIVPSNLEARTLLTRYERRCDKDKEKRFTKAAQQHEEAGGGLPSGSPALHGHFRAD